MKKILAGAGVILIVFQFMAQISSLEKTLREYEEILKENEKTSLELNMKLSEQNKHIDNLENENESLREENEELQNRLNSMIKLEATAYTAFCPTGCIGVTKTGHDVSSREKINGMRVVAVDPSVIPLGTTMTVHTEDSSFEAIALDTGGDIQGKRLDILVESREVAYDFGRKDVVVELGHRVDPNSLQ